MLAINYCYLTLLSIKKQYDGIFTSIHSKDLILLSSAFIYNRLEHQVVMFVSMSAVIFPIQEVVMNVVILNVALWAITCQQSTSYTCDIFHPIVALILAGCWKDSTNIWKGYLFLQVSSWTCTSQLWLVYKLFILVIWASYFSGDSQVNLWFAGLHCALLAGTLRIPWILFIEI